VRFSSMAADLGSATAARTVFDHIPRTAGTSVRTALAVSIGEPGDPAEPTCPHYAALEAAGARRFLASHFWFYPGEALSPDWYYATLLREPADRFLSQYCFFRAHRADVLSGAMTDPDVVAAVAQPVDEYVADPARRRSYTNVQARHFAWRMCEAPEQLDDRRLLEAAIASLGGYDLVGIWTDAQGFLDAYCDALSVPRRMLPHVNAAEGRTGLSALSTRTVERLRAANTVDAALCDWARQRGVDTSRRLSRRVVPAPSCIEFGSRDIEILSCRCGAAGTASALAAVGERILIRLQCRARVVERDLTAGIAVRDERGRLVYGTNSRLLGMPISVAVPHFELSFALDLRLPIGAYRVTLALHKGLAHQDGCYHWKDRAAAFQVVRATPSESDETPRPNQNDDTGRGAPKAAGDQAGTLRASDGPSQ